MRAVYFFCNDLSKDPVAPHVYEEFLKVTAPIQTAITFDGSLIYECQDAFGNQYSFVATREVQSHQYARSFSEMTALFSNCDFAGIVNWHEGNNAPDRIFTVHSTGDVPSGIFAKSNPLLFRNLLRAIRSILASANIKEDFRVCTEATHWSGVMYGSEPELLASFDVPTYDIEIGSSKDSWGNREAASILAKALLRLFDEAPQPKTLLAVGGVHFEESFGQVMLNDDYPVSVAHILPNQWVVSGKYEEPEGMDKLLRCVDKIIGGIDGIVFHDNLKGDYKQQCRTLAQKLNVPIFKHQILKDSKRLREVLEAKS
jgi:D-tyrosyl-tRNA(Tyr) deacylase